MLLIDKNVLGTRSSVGSATTERITRLRDTQVVDLDELELDYSRLEDAQTCLTELVTPSVVASEYPGSDGRAALNSGL
jgi:hypothetical protein